MHKFTSLHYGKAADNILSKYCITAYFGFVDPFLDCSRFALQKVPVYIVHLYCFMQSPLYICYKKINAM